MLTQLSSNNRSKSYEPICPSPYTSIIYKCLILVSSLIEISLTQEWGSCPISLLEEILIGVIALFEQQRSFI